MKKMFMVNLQILHLPKLYTNGLIDSYIQGLSSKCPKLEEIGFVIDEDVVSLPIDELFQKSHSLKSLNLKFDMPRILIQTGNEERVK